MSHAPPFAGNLWAGLPDDGDAEWFQDLLRMPSLRIERIASLGQASPEGFWYEQAWPEWVLLVRGTAELTFEDEVRRLVAGDYLLIPALRRHRVTGTSHDALWLALHFDLPPPAVGEDEA